MDALKDWLRTDRWEVREAACIIAGVLPPERMGDASDFGGVLPGREAWQDAREAWREIVAAEVAHIERLLKDQSPPKDAKPQGFLALAVQLELFPPWLGAARADAEARALLPPEALEGHAPTDNDMTPLPLIVDKKRHSGRKVSASNLVAGFILWRLHQDNFDIMPADAERAVAAAMKGSPYKPPAKRWIEDKLPSYRAGVKPRELFAHNVRVGVNAEGMTVDKAEETAARLLALYIERMPRE